MHLLEWRGDHHIAEMVLETRVATGTFGADEILPEIRAGHVQVVMTALENLPPVALAWLAVEGLEVALDANRPNLVLDLAETLVQRRDGRVEQTFVTWLERDVDVSQRKNVSKVSLRGRLIAWAMPGVTLVTLGAFALAWFSGYPTRSSLLEATASFSRSNNPNPNSRST